MNVIYKTRVEVKGGRNGHVKSDDGVIDLDVRMPKEMGGSESGYTNPEQLFAAGYSACFDGALNLVARQERIKVKDTVVAVTVGFGEDEDGGFGICAKIEVHIPEVAKKVAEDLMNKAHQVCPYSKATRGNIKVELVLI
jgi:Ohr subfamily peroxiredoxin